MRTRQLVVLISAFVLQGVLVSPLPAQEGRSDPPGPGMGGGMAMQGGPAGMMGTDDLQKRFREMQHMMDRIHGAKSSAERRRLMREHMEAMHEVMGKMHGMMSGGMMGRGMGQGGPAGMARSGGGKGPAGMSMEQRQNAMAQRMAIMQQMMEQMLDQMMVQQGGAKKHR